MTAENATLQRLRVTKEAAGSYAVDDSANVGTNGIDVPFVEGSIKASGDQELFSPKIGSSLLEYNDLKLPGRTKSTFAFSMPLHSHGVPIDGTTTLPTTSTWALMRILEVIFGAVASTTNGGARTVQAGTTTSVLTVTAGRGNDFSPGDAVGVRVTGAAAGTMEVREVLSVTANTITVVEQFSALPVTGGTVYGAVTAYSIDDPTASLQFVLEGTEADDRRCFRGAQGTPKFELPVGNEVPKISFDLKGSNWARLGSGSVSPASFGTLGLFVPVFNELHYTTVSGTTVARNVVDQSAQTWEPGIAYDEVRSGGRSSTNNILRMKRKPVKPPLKASFTSIFEDGTFETERAAGTVKRMDLQLGNAPGSTILISCRSMQVVDVEDAVHESGIGGQKVSLEGRIPSAGTDARTRSVSVIHFM